MSAVLTLNYGAILAMAAMAVLIAALFPFPPAVGVKAQVSRGLARAFLGVVGATAIWTGSQVVGQIMEDKLNPRWTQPVIMPVPVPMQVKPPGHDI